jgi:hypothetical protein
MPVAAILVDADVNNTCGYYHCNDIPKYVHDHNDLLAIVLFYSSVPS